jgi:MATE family multidrug resistance protein
MSGDHQTLRFDREIGATLRLAAPLALAQLAQIAMGVTDTILLGTLGRDGLAAGGLGANLYFTLMVVVAGGLISVSILVAHARGSGAETRIAPILRGGMLLALLASIPPMLLLWNIEPIVLAIGEPPELAHAIAAYDRILLFALPGSLLMATQRNFLAAMGRPWIVMVVALAAITANGLLNYALIHGAWGFPRMGYLGSATATLITLWAMMLAVALAMRLTEGLRAFALAGPVDWDIVRELLALGAPIAAIMAVEIVLFSGAGLLIGRFGTSQLAAHQISINICSFTFMVPLSISQAANVRVGFFMGAESPRAARLSAVAAFVLGIGFMGMTAVTFLTIPSLIAGFYITASDPNRAEVIAVAVQLLTIAAFFQVFDGAQTISAGALRGLKDTRIPAVVAAIGYWGLGFLPGWVLGVKMGFGAVGIWWGLASGLAAVAISLSIRFWILSGKLIAAQLVAKPPTSPSPAEYATQH